MRFYRILSLVVGNQRLSNGWRPVSVSLLWPIDLTDVADSRRTPAPILLHQLGSPSPRLCLADLHLLIAKHLSLSFLSKGQTYAPTFSQLDAPLVMNLRYFSRLLCMSNPRMSLPVEVPSAPVLIGIALTLLFSSPSRKFSQT